MKTDDNFSLCPQAVARVLRANNLNHLWSSLTVRHLPQTASVPLPQTACTVPPQTENRSSPQQELASPPLGVAQSVFPGPVSSGNSNDAAAILLSPGGQAMLARFVPNEVSLSICFSITYVDKNSTIPRVPAYSDAFAAALIIVRQAGDFELHYSKENLQVPVCTLLQRVAYRILQKPIIKLFCSTFQEARTGLTQSLSRAALKYVDKTRAPLADLSTVYARLNMLQEGLTAVREGQAGLRDGQVAHAEELGRIAQTGQATLATAMSSLHQAMQSGPGRLASTQYSRQLTRPHAGVKLTKAANRRAKARLKTDLARRGTEEPRSVQASFNAEFACQQYVAVWQISDVRHQAWLWILMPVQILSTAWESSIVVAGKTLPQYFSLPLMFSCGPGAQYNTLLLGAVGRRTPSTPASARSSQVCCQLYCVDTCRAVANVGWCNQRVGRWIIFILEDICSLIIGDWLSTKMLIQGTAANSRKSEDRLWPRSCIFSDLCFHSGYQRILQGSSGLKELYLEVFGGIILDLASKLTTDSIMCLEVSQPRWRGGNTMCKQVKQRKEIAFYIHQYAAQLRHSEVPLSCSGSLLWLCHTIL